MHRSQKEPLTKFRCQPVHAVPSCSRDGPPSMAFAIRVARRCGECKCVGAEAQPLSGSTTEPCDCERSHWE
eukprot:11524608-Alexandrium_andersonii.AAC.1